jgi:hypothetical protein
MEMANHCDWKVTAAFVADDQFTPLTSSEGGNVVRYRLEAGEVEWEIAPGKKGVERFGTIRIASRRPSTARVPSRLREIASLDTTKASVTRTVKLGFKMSLRRGFDFVVNGERHHHDEPVKVGQLQVWDVVNTTMMDHPFHLHGFFFEVLEIDGKKPAWRSLEDVINVGPKSTVRIAWYLMGLSGVTYLVQGWLAGSEGFSPTHTFAIVLAEILNLAWMIWLAVVAWRMPDSEAPSPGR